MDRDNSVTASLKKGFLLWSWVGLIGAYIATSTLFGTSIFMFTLQGIRIFEHSFMFRVLLMYGFLVPIVILAMAWLTFYRYSIALFEVAVIDSVGLDARKIMFLFKRSLLYLIMSWIVALLLFVIPLATTAFYRV